LLLLAQWLQIVAGVKYQHEFGGSCAVLHWLRSWLKVKLGMISSSTVSIPGLHPAGSCACVNGAVIDVNKAGLKKLTLQLKCEAALNFVHLALRASQVDRKIRTFFSACPSITRLSYISVKMCLSEASDINFLLFSNPFSSLFHRQILFRINRSPL